MTTGENVLARKSGWGKRILYALILLIVLLIVGRYVLPMLGSEQRVTSQGDILTFWYENGQKQSEGTFKSPFRDQEVEGIGYVLHGSLELSLGKREGVWTFWDEQGNVTKTETYNNGELVK